MSAETKSEVAPGSRTVTIKSPIPELGLVPGDRVVTLGERAVVYRIIPADGLRGHQDCLEDARHPPPSPE